MMIVSVFEDVEALPLEVRFSLHREHSGLWMCYIEDLQGMFVGRSKDPSVAIGRALKERIDRQVLVAQADARRNKTYYLKGPGA